MKESSRKTELLIKGSLIAVAGLLLVVLFIMSQIPPSGQWVKDSVAPVFPTLKYSHINEFFGNSYKPETKPPEIVTISPPLGPPRGLPKDDKDTFKSYFSSPRFFISDRNRFRRQSMEVPVSAIQTVQNYADAQDLLEQDSNTHMTYNSAFGSSRSVAKLQCTKK